MTGIDRLRHVAHGWDSKVISSIADQIDRELREERDRWDSELCEAQMDKTRVMAVYLEMSKHVSGVEGADDSPVARWARELRDALKSDTSDGRDAQKPSWHDPAEAADVTSDAAKVTRDPAEDVSMSAYDLLPQEDRDAIAWVREHGGLERVNLERDSLYGTLRETCWRLGVEYFGVWTTDAQRIWGKIDWYKDRLTASVPRVAHERHIIRRQRQIDESHAALRRRNERIRELERKLSEAVSAQLASDAALYDLRREVRDQCQAFGVDLSLCDNASEMLHDMNAELSLRLMPPGLSWPMWDDCEPITYDDAPGDAIGVFLALDGSCWATMAYVPDGCHEADERVKRPAKVLDADGAEIRKGDTVWDTKGNGPYVVDEISGDGTVLIEGRDLGYDGADFTHRAPVLAADGKPLREGETVWSINGNGPFTVEGFDGAAPYVLLRDESSLRDIRSPESLTHERPESWKRLEEDAEKDPCGYFGFDGEEICGKCPASGKNCEQTMARDLVRRCRALAERERGE